MPGRRDTLTFSCSNTHTHAVARLHLFLMLKFLPRWRCLRDGCLERAGSTVSKSASSPVHAHTHVHTHTSANEGNQINPVCNTIHYGASKSADNRSCQRTVVGEIQRADGGDSGEELLDYSSSRRPQLARKQKTHTGREEKKERRQHRHKSESLEAVCSGNCSSFPHSG